MLDSVEEDLINDIRLKILSQCESCKIANKILCEKCNRVYTSCYLAVRSHIPKKNLSITMKHLNSPDVQEAKAKIQHYIDELETNRKNGKILFIYGGKTLSEGKSFQTGTGKTSLGCIVLKKAIAHSPNRYSAYFCNIIELKTDINKEEVKQKISTVDFFMIDGLGEFRLTESTETVCNIVTLILQIRCRKALPTIITTSLNRDTFFDAYGEEIKSLLYEHAVFVDCSGEDYRKTHMASKNNPGEFDS